MGKKYQKKTVHPEHWFVQGVQCHGEGRLDEAVLLYRKVIQHCPNHAQALNNWGMIDHDQGLMDQAAARFQQALAIKPDFPEAMNNLASLLQQQGKLEEARVLFLRAIQRNPEYMEAYFNIGTLYQTLGQWDFALDAFSKALKFQPNNPQILFHLGFAHQHQGQFQKAESFYRHVLKLQPQHLQALNNLGQVALHLRQPDQTITCLRELVALQPNFPEAWNNMGIAWDILERTHRAVECFETALEYQPNFPEALNNYGNVLLKQDQPLLALEYYEQALCLNPEYVEALCNLGGGLHQVGKLDAALDTLQRARSLQPDFPSAHYNESMIHLLLGDCLLGFRQYEWRWLSKDFGSHHYGQPLWNGQPLPEATILIHCEQGFGDSIQFIRYVQHVIPLVGRVVLMCPDPLRRLFQTIPGIDVFISYFEPIPHCDCQAPLLSLPYLFGTTLETIPNAVPYLKPCPDAVARFAQRLAHVKTTKIGIAWHGNPRQKNDRNRSIDPKHLVRLLDTPGCTFISLQVDDYNPGLSFFFKHPQFIDWTREFSDFADTAALITQLDLVISVDTSVIHLTGALGCPGWVLLPAIPDWRWLLDRSDCPWYPTVHLFRQSQAKNWEGVVERVMTQLHNWLAERQMIKK
ncbi:MAG: tetratricopeptide repeat protein [Magnetococcales bacterium]|nr:tetratricopeptide repeat protein [Magnetococcales bacterium]